MFRRLLVESRDFSGQERVHLRQLSFQFFADLSRFLNQQRARRFSGTTHYAAHYPLQAVLEPLQIVDVILAAGLNVIVVERLLDRRDFLVQRLRFVQYWFV